MKRKLYIAFLLFFTSPILASESFFSVENVVERLDDLTFRILDSQDFTGKHANECVLQYTDTLEYLTRADNAHPYLEKIDALVQAYKEKRGSLAPHDWILKLEASARRLAMPDASKLRTSEITNNLKKRRGLFVILIFFGLYLTPVDL